MKKLSGKMSTFGGPKDTGVSASEGLALFEPRDLRDPRVDELFLSEQPVGTTGLARRLNPEMYYIACRWDYSETPKNQLRLCTVKVSANGRSVQARPVDWGPNEETNRVADLSPGAAEFLRLKTDDVVEVEGIFPLEPPQPLPTPGPGPGLSDPGPVGRTFEVGPDHWLIGVKREEIEGGSEIMTRRCVVEHYTEGATAMSSIEAMRSRSLSAHVVVDRDGAVYQCRPFNRKCEHAGPSKWADPKTREPYSGLNGCSIGIEIANAGNGEEALKWARKQPGFRSIRAKHRNGGPEMEWEVFYEPQMAAVIGVTQAVVKRYNLDDVTGHDCIAPNRKVDPGPAFPMEKVRLATGFSGLPVVHY